MHVENRGENLLNELSCFFLREYFVLLYVIEEVSPLAQLHN